MAPHTRLLNSWRWPARSAGRIERRSRQPLAALVGIGAAILGLLVYGMPMSAVSAAATSQDSSAGGLTPLSIVANYTVSGCTVNDLVGDGARAPEDPAVPGWTVELSRNGSFFANATTGPSGCFSIPLNQDGAFSLRALGRPGWKPTSALYHNFSGVGSVDQTGLDFLAFQQATFGGCKYNDTNGNGVWDPGELGILGWSVDVLRGNSIYGGGVTDPLGCYVVPIADPGTYTVRERTHLPYISRGPSFYCVTALSGLNLTGLNFFNQIPPPVNVTGCKINDTNGDGDVDAGEGPLKGWAFDIYRDGQYVGTGTTDDNGCYTFNITMDGNYTIREQAQADWHQTAPENPDYHHFRVQGGVVVDDSWDGPAFQFLNTPIGNHTGGGCKVNDLDGDGVWDQPGEPTIPYWNFLLRNAAGDTTVVTTGPDGCFKFTLIGDSTYTLTEGPSGGWRTTAPLSAKYDIVVSGGAIVTPALGTRFNFLNTNSTDKNCKVNDLNADGVWQRGIEPTMPNWTIVLHQPDGTTVTMTTGDDGCYNLSLTQNGNYTLTEVLKAGWRYTWPPNMEYRIDVAGGAIASVTPAGTTSFDFLNTRNWTFSGCKVNDANGNGRLDAGEEKLGNWAITVTRGGNTYISTRTGTDGCYVIVLPGDGTYVVSEAVQGGWHATVAPPQYTITIGGGQAAISPLADPNHLDFHNQKDDGNGPICVMAAVAAGAVGVAALGAFMARRRRA